MLADHARARRHGTRTTFVRVADLPVGGAEAAWPPAAGEVRIVGTPSGRKAAVDRVREVASRAGGTPVSAFALPDLERIATADGATVRSVLEELRSAGLELIAEAPVEIFPDAR